MAYIVPQFSPRDFDTDFTGVQALANTLRAARQQEIQLNAQRAQQLRWEQEMNLKREAERRFADEQDRRERQLQLQAAVDMRRAVREGAPDEEVFGYAQMAYPGGQMGEFRPPAYEKAMAAQQAFNQALPQKQALVEANYAADRVSGPPDAAVRPQAEQYRQAGEGRMANMLPFMGAVMPGVRGAVEQAGTAAMAAGKTAADNATPGGSAAPDLAPPPQGAQPAPQAPQQPQVAPPLQDYVAKRQAQQQELEGYVKQRMAPAFPLQQGFARAREAQQGGDLVRAAAEQQALAANALTPQDRAKALFSEANLRLKAGDLDGARALMQQAQTMGLSGFNVASGVEGDEAGIPVEQAMERTIGDVTQALAVRDPRQVYRVPGAPGPEGQPTAGMVIDPRAWREEEDAKSKAAIDQNKNLSPEESASLMAARDLPPSVAKALQGIIQERHWERSQERQDEKFEESKRWHQTLDDHFHGSMDWKDRFLDAYDRRSLYARWRDIANDEKGWQALGIGQLGALESQWSKHLASSGYRDLMRMNMQTRTALMNTQAGSVPLQLRGAMQTLLRIERLGQSGSEGEFAALYKHLSGYVGDLETWWEKVQSGGLGERDAAQVRAAVNTAAHETKARGDLWMKSTADRFLNNPTTAPFKNEIQRRIRSAAMLIGADPEEVESIIGTPDDVATPVQLGAPRRNPTIAERDEGSAADNNRIAAARAASKKAKTVPLPAAAKPSAGETDEEKKRKAAKRQADIDAVRGML